MIKCGGDGARAGRFPHRGCLSRKPLAKVPGILSAAAGSPPTAARRAAKNAEFTRLYRGYRPAGAPPLPDSGYLDTTSTWSSSSSTGVSRPNMETTTMTLFFSGLISSTTPVKDSSGPSLMRTWSPTL